MHLMGLLMQYIQNSILFEKTHRFILFSCYSVNQKPAVPRIDFHHETRFDGFSSCYVVHVIYLSVVYSFFTSQIALSFSINREGTHRADRVCIVCRYTLALALP